MPANGRLPGGDYVFAGHKHRKLKLRARYYKVGFKIKYPANKTMDTIVYNVSTLFT
jgi:hypothetical protein